MKDHLRAIGTAAYMGGIWAPPEEFTWCWGALREFTAQFLPGEGEMVYFTRSKMSLLTHARSALAMEELRGDWLWMTDTDHSFPPETLYTMVKLMERYQVPVLSGIYRHKALPHHPVLWSWHKNDDGDEGFRPIIEHAKGAPIFQVDGVGGGCLLVHRVVFDQLAVQFPEEGPFDSIGRYSEDLSFCLRCRKAQIPICATPLVETTHLTPQFLDDSTYVADWFNPHSQTDIPVAAAAME